MKLPPCSSPRGVAPRAWHGHAMTDLELGQYASITLVPESERWASLLEENRARPLATELNLRTDDLLTLRRCIVRAARDYVAQLTALAQRHGVSLPASDTEIDVVRQDDADSPLVLTGHQPSILHPGIAYKYEVTERFAASHHFTAVAVLMDVDAGNAGEFLTPSAVDASTPSPAWPVVGTKLATIAHSDALYLGQCLRSANELDALARDVELELRSCQAAQAADQFTTMMTTYRQLAGRSAIMANSIVRRAHQVAPRLLELPFSTLCGVPFVQQWLARLSLDGQAFHHAYNQTLDTWRKQRKLRNPANPFPNLERRGDRLELPFWRVDLKARTRQIVWGEFSPGRVQLFADHEPITEFADGELSADERSDSEWLLAPRGALITILFRLLCSDLFVHGLGGQTYDQYTDRLIENYFGIAPPHFVVASASRYLFERQRQELEQLDQLAAHQRQLEHHPEKYLGQGWFSSELEQRLRPWLDEKQRLIAILREKQQSGASASDEGKRLEDLRNNIKLSVAAEFAGRLTRLNGLTTSARQAIQSRNFPWFYFA